MRKRVGTGGLKRVCAGRHRATGKSTPGMCHVRVFVMARARDEFLLMQHEVCLLTQMGMAPDGRESPGPPYNTALCQRSTGRSAVIFCGERRLEQRGRVSGVAQHTLPLRPAQKTGYVSRAAYKLLEIQDKHKIIKPGA